jgi:hypothetical protein
MRSRSASSPDGRAGLVGSYRARVAWVVLSVRAGRDGSALVVAEREAVPGIGYQGEVLGMHGDAGRALLQAEALVLARGGRLGEAPGALSEGPVRSTLARSMFTELGLRRFVHVPAGGRAGAA